ncbi:MAG: arsenic-transporting ATPase [Clostridiales bacterium]|nr:MAG: arsenic-transporting ATPase [Clostridiales bacterium]
MNKIVFFGGKGGVGKTSCSAAFAAYTAKQGKKTLIVSTDPAHSISDIFEMPIGMDTTHIRDNLDGIEIDAEHESEKYIEGVKRSLGKVISPIIMEEINRQLDASSISPGTHEAAVFDKMIEIIVEKSGDYDQIVFDTAPTGHTIRLFSLPELLGVWIDSLLAKRERALEVSQMTKSVDRGSKDYLDHDPILKILNRRKTNMEKAREIMIDDKKLDFIFVLNAEKLPIEETKKAIDILKKYDMPVRDLVINRILPDKMTDDFWKAKKEDEVKYVAEIEGFFSDKSIIKLPLLPKDMRAHNIDDMAAYFEDALGEK